MLTSKSWTMGRLMSLIYMEHKCLHLITKQDKPWKHYLTTPFTETHHSIALACTVDQRYNHTDVRQYMVSYTRYCISYKILRSINMIITWLLNWTNWSIKLVHRSSYQYTTMIEFRHLRYKWERNIQVEKKGFRIPTFDKILVLKPQTATGSGLLLVLIPFIAA